MLYPGRSLVHDRKFDRDCEEFFGSLERADDRLAAFLFELAHGVVHGIKITSTVSAFMADVELSCVVIVELCGGDLFLRGLVVLDVAARVAA